MNPRPSGWGSTRPSVTRAWLKRTRTWVEVSSRGEEGGYPLAGYHIDDGEGAPAGPGEMGHVPTPDAVLCPHQPLRPCRPGDGHPPSRLGQDEAVYSHERLHQSLRTPAERHDGRHTAIIEPRREKGCPDAYPLPREPRDQMRVDISPPNPVKGSDAIRFAPSRLCSSRQPSSLTKCEPRPVSPNKDDGTGRRIARTQKSDQFDQFQIFPWRWGSRGRWPINRVQSQKEARRRRLRVALGGDVAPLHDDL